MRAWSVRVWRAKLTPAPVNICTRPAPHASKARAKKGGTAAQCLSLGGLRPECDGPGACDILSCGLPGLRQGPSPTCAAPHLRHVPCPLGPALPGRLCSHDVHADKQAFVGGGKRRSSPRSRRAGRDCITRPTPHRRDCIARPRPRRLDARGRRLGARPGLVPASRISLPGLRMLFTPEAGPAAQKLILKSNKLNSNRQRSKEGCCESVLARTGPALFFVKDLSGMEISTTLSNSFSSESSAIAP